MSHSRNSSRESVSTMSDAHSASPSSPTHLILVQDPDDLPELELWQDGSSDEGYDPEQGLVDDVDRERGRSALDPSNPPLNSFKIMPLVISPIVKLGTILLLVTSQTNDTLPLPLPAAAIAVIVAGGLNSLATQIHVLLGRYVKRWTIEGIVAEAFVGVESSTSRNRRDREPWKEKVVLITKAMVILGSSLLCAAYIRGKPETLGRVPHQ
ncbi:hypothetical protein FRC03_005888 [Tulasnella sp. 419]|nr:hypothetical protein FRC03_005888 [Tulasnella sp. 419]